MAVLVFAYGIHREPILGKDTQAAGAKMQKVLSHEEGGV